MGSRESSAARAREVLEICEAGSYATLSGGKPVEVSLGDLQPARFLPAEEAGQLNYPERGPCGKLTVTGESAVSDVLRAARENPGKLVGVLNFASSLHPGGGFITGAIAQEEALCHASTLYLQLKRCETLYEENRKSRCDTYTDNMAVSRTLFFKNASGVLLPSPAEALVVTSAAVNQNKVRDKCSDRVNGVMRSRMHKILQVFIREQCNILILGAFGCGVFKNDARFIAQVWQEELSRYGGYFDEVIFSVMGNRDSYNVKAFLDTFCA